MGKEFVFGDIKIDFGEDFVNYNRLRKRYIDLSVSTYNEFEKVYDSNCSNIEDVYKKILNIGYGCIYRNIDEAISILISNDLMYIDKDTFLSKYYSNLLTWEDDFNKAYSKYSKVSNEEEKEKIFRDELKSELAQSVRHNVFCIHYAIVDALRANGITNVSKYVSIEAEEKSKALFNNLKSGLIPNDKEERIIKEIISNNPYNKSIYIYLLNKLGDKDGSIGNATEFLDINISREKRQLIKKYYNSLSTDTEKITLESLEKFKAYAESINVSDINWYISEFNRILKNHDIKIRTIDGILFETREEASLAKKEYLEIKSIRNNITCNTEKYISDAIKKIEEKNFKTAIKDKHLNELNKKLVEVIRFEEELFLNDKYNVEGIYKEEEADRGINELNSLKLRNMDLVENRIKEFKTKRENIIREKDKAFVDAYFNTVVILNESDIKKAIVNIRNLGVRTDEIKDEKIRYITEKSDKIIKKHNEMLDKAIKYEERIKSIKEVRKDDKKGVLGFINKAIEKGTNLIDEYQEKKEREAWEFITNNGTRNIEEFLD